MQKSHNLSAIAFTLIVFIAVLLGGVARSDRPHGITEIKESRTEDTSVSAKYQTASVSDTVSSAGGSVFSPSVSAVSAVAQGLNDSQPAFALNIDQQWPTASLAKLMTALVVLRRSGGEPSEVLSFNEGPLVKVSARAIATESSAGNLVSGQSYRLAELLRVMLVFSSNDAAEAIAESYGRDAFIEEMNRMAVELGMRNTRFFDPAGLSPLNQSNIRDLIRLVRYINDKKPDIFVISREKSEGATHPFAGEQDFLGGKTGFLDEADGNLISLFNYNGSPFLTIVLGSRQRSEDTKILHDWFLAR